MPFRRHGYSNSGQPKQEEESIWEKLATSHPHLADELADRLPAWVSSRKRRGSRDRVDPEFSSGVWSRQPRDSLLNNFPTEFRQYIPSEWSTHFSTGDIEPQPSAQPTSSHIPKFDRQQSSEKATQTVEGELTPNLNQYKLRNTVDLGQKTKAEQEDLEGEENRKQRSMSAPPNTRVSTNECSTMDPPINMENLQHSSQQQDESINVNKQPNVRHIPIFVEGRDEPVINTHKDVPINYTDSRATPPKDQYFMEHEMPQSFHPLPPYTRAWSPFQGFSNRNMSGFGPKKFSQTNNQPQQNFTQHQPQQSQNIHVEDSTPQNVHHQPQREKSPDHQENKENVKHQDEIDTNTPQKTHNLPINDPIAKIQSIQKDVLDLMSKVEIFDGKSKKDKEYIYLDEMLTRNLIKLDDVETEGKENIRLARKEAIKCIQQCIAVLEAKVDSNNEVGANEKQEVAMEEENQTQNEESGPPLDISNLDVSKDGIDKTPMEVDANNTSSQ